MIFLQVLKFLVFYSFIELFVLCEFMGSDAEAVNAENLEGIEDEKNSVLDSVYDTMRHNYEIKLRHNLDRLNLIRDIRNKRNINEPLSMTPDYNNINTLNNLNQMNSISGDYYKNHQYEVNRKMPVNFPLGYKSPQIIPVAVAPSSRQSDSYEYEEYHNHKCQEKPTVQTFHISDNQEHEKKHHFTDIAAVLLTGLKALLGVFAVFALLALPFILLKALFLPFKFLLFFKALTLVKTFFLLSLFFRFLRFNRRVTGNNNFFGVPGKNKHKLQTIKDILNSEDTLTEEDIDYKSDDEGVVSKESAGAPMFFDNPFNSSDVSEDFVQNLVKLIKLKNKKW